MLAQKYIEKAVQELQKQAENIGLSITEFLVKNPRLIRELEKKRIGLFRIPLKPAFVSPKNYRRLNLKEDEYGFMFGIKFKKTAENVLSSKVKK